MMTIDQLTASVVQAEAYFSAGQYDEAYQAVAAVQASLNEANAAQENFPSALLVRLAKTLRSLGDEFDDGAEQYNEAQRVLAKALNWFPDDVKLLNEQGWLHYYTAKYDKAIAYFEKTLKTTDPATTKEDTRSASHGLGASLRKQRNFSEAEDIFEKLIVPNEEVPAGTLVQIGWLAFDQKRYARSFSYFSDALKRDEADSNDRYLALLGQVVSLQAEDATTFVDDDRARAIISDYVSELAKDSTGPEPLLSAKRSGARILVTCASIHSDRNNYPAALLSLNYAVELDPDNQRSHEFKIEALKWMRRFEKAEEAYLVAQKLFPDNVDIWNEIGNSYYQQKRYWEALGHFNGTALKDRTFPDQATKDTFARKLKEDEYAMEWTIVVLRKMYNLDAADKKVDEALALQPHNVSFFAEKAVIFFSKQKYHEAIQLFDRVLALDEYNEFALQWRAASYRRLKLFAEAKKYLEEALQKVPMSTGLWEERAWLSFDQDDLEKADEYFQASIDRDPYLIQRQFSRVEVLLRLNRGDTPLEVFENLKKQFPDDAEVEEQLGWFYLRKGNLLQAKEEFLKIQEREPNNVLGINGMGGVYLEERDFCAAERNFRSALELVNYEPQYHLNLAWALIRQVKNLGELPKSDFPKREKLLEEAAASCRSALTLDPFNAKAYVCLGVIAFRRNSYLDAEGYFRRSVALNPNDDGQIELGSLYCQMGRYEDAKIKLTEAIKANANDARAHVEMGNLLVVTGNNTEAVKECRQAVSIDPANEETHRALAIALMRDGQYEEAEKALRRAMNVVGKSRQWQLHLLLSQILIRLGDDNSKDQDLYTEALKHVNEAKRLYANPNAEIYFHEGIAQYKLEDYRQAHRNFRDCLKSNRDRFEAERYGRVVKSLIREQNRVLRVNTAASLLLAVLCLGLLFAVSTAYYRGMTRPVPASAAKNDNSGAADAADAAGAAKDKVEAALTGASLTDSGKPHDELIVDRTMLTFLFPLLLGLLVVALVLPNLNKLKLPGGFEAEISESKISEPKTKDISSGPKGDIGFGSSLPIISPGPFKG